ncbi:MAG TPA: DNA mismatch repair protein MutS [Bacteroidetes bacterium]|nr:DNA mismatch repair protein MutS [Bacteroidota bacterium]
MEKKRPDIAETPLMKQYNRMKAKHPDAILLFRVGDFYETFGEDAIRASGILGITLTRRANGAASYVELAGFPHHALDTYLPKLVRAGQRVAICEQLEDPKLAKKIVKRGITELVTPGVSLNDNVLERRENNFLAAVYPERITGVAFLDISTGEFLAAEGTTEYVDKLLNNFRPREILVEKSKKNLFKENFAGKYYLTTLDDWYFSEESATDRLLKHFETASLKGFGIHSLRYGIIAAGAILQYLDLTQHDKLKHISSLSRIEEDHYVWLDKFTVRNLELFQSLYENAGTLIEVIDRTVSPMGARMLKRWISLPLKELKPLIRRQNIVGVILENDDFRELLEDEIKHIGDLERLVSKVATGRINPREVVQIKNALVSVEEIQKACLASRDTDLKQLGESLDLCLPAREKIAKEIAPDPPVQMSRGGVIAEGVSPELDELRELFYSGKDYLEKLQAREIEQTGIPSLKIGFNNVFGYYIEVRNTHKDKVPPEWIRKQTLVSAERYITEELKEYENKILGAEVKILELESSLFSDLVESIVPYIVPLQKNASVIAELDCLYSLAVVASENNYNKPNLNESDVIDIKDGRHPVIEKQLPMDEEYVPNDVYLDNKKQQIIILTGPNMSGKSALLRQTALIVLLAQIGGYVPAREARIGLVDKIFTRVGASDNISLGESTFMVEMQEAASILNNLSSRSLVLLDEIGRGTSTYDGISIAWAMVEYIHEHPFARAKTLFATHYHELNEMEKTFERVKNFNVSIREMNDKVIFLRKLKRGGSEHSFGIHVARMAGMPKSVVSRAKEILKDLEKSQDSGTLTRPADLAENREGFQLSIFQLEDPVLKQIRDELIDLDINNLTPVEALNKLNDIKKHLKQ